MSYQANNETLTANSTAREHDCTFLASLVSSPCPLCPHVRHLAAHASRRGPTPEAAAASCQPTHLPCRAPQSAADAADAIHEASQTSHDTLTAKNAAGAAVGAIRHQAEAAAHAVGDALHITKGTSAESMQVGLGWWHCGARCCTTA